jgi:hypothetical protein
MWKRLGMLLVAVALIMGSAVPVFAWYGHGGYGYRGYGHYGHRWGSVVVVPRIVVPFGVPYVYPPAIVSPPPVYVQPAPQVYIQPPPQSYWYYCDSAQAYYPYIQQCPGGWRQVAPAPPQ